MLYVHHNYQHQANWGSVHQEARLSFSEYRLAYQVKELIATPSCTYNLLLLMPVVETCLFSINLCKVFLGPIFYFAAADFYEVLH
jgi:hypothetical protein